MADLARIDRITGVWPYETMAAGWARGSRGGGGSLPGGSGGGGGGYGGGPAGPYGSYGGFSPGPAYVGVPGPTTTITVEKFTKSIADSTRNIELFAIGLGTVYKVIHAVASGFQGYAAGGNYVSQMAQGYDRGSNIRAQMAAGWSTSPGMGALVGFLKAIPGAGAIVSAGEASNISSMQLPRRAMIADYWQSSRNAMMTEGINTMVSQGVSAIGMQTGKGDLTKQYEAAQFATKAQYGDIAAYEENLKSTLAKAYRQQEAYQAAFEKKQRAGFGVGMETKLGDEPWWVARKERGQLGVTITELQGMIDIAPQIDKRREAYRRQQLVDQEAYRTASNAIGTGFGGTAGGIGYGVGVGFSTSGGGYPYLPQNPAYTAIRGELMDPAGAISAVGEAAKLWMQDRIGKNP